MGHGIWSSPGAWGSGAASRGEEGAFFGKNEGEKGEAFYRFGEKTWVRGRKKVVGGGKNGGGAALPFSGGGGGWEV